LIPTWTTIVSEDGFHIRFKPHDKTTVLVHYTQFIPQMSSTMIALTSCQLELMLAAMGCVGKD
jgi:hypothetical protein